MMRTRSILQNLVTLAAVACAMQEYGPAVRLLRAVAALLVTSHQVMELMQQQVYDQSLTEARARMEAKTFDSAWAAGQALPLKEAITEGLSIAALARSRNPDSSLSSYPAGLTPREVQVLRFVASLYRKLNTSSRAVATRFAVEHGLA
jgi:DNA-binding CsgD family transcriptional regulator